MTACDKKVKRFSARGVVSEMSGLRLIFGNRAAVVRKRAEQASASFAILSRSRSAGRTADGERLFWPELCHGENDNASTLKSRVVNFDQMLLTAHFGACSSLACAQNRELVQSFPYPHISDPTAEGLPWIVPATRRSLAPLVKTRGFGKTNAIGPGYCSSCAPTWSESTVCPGGGTTTVERLLSAVSLRKSARSWRCRSSQRPSSSALWRFSFSN